MAVSNYKSLFDFHLDLDHFNVFVGPNSAGKSNIFDCFSFLASLAATQDVAKPLSERYGFRNIAFGFDDRVEISMLFEMVVGKKEFHYEFSFDRDRVITEELLNVNGDEWLRRALDRAMIRNEAKGEMMEIGPGPSALTISVIHDNINFPTVLQFREAIERIGVFQFDPESMREYVQPLHYENPGRRGESLAGYIHFLLSAHYPSLKRVRDALVDAMASVEELSSPLTPDGRTYIAVRESPFPTPFDSHQVSDGMLKFLAVVSVLSSPTPPISILLEEPENFIHPRLLDFIVDLARKCEAQVLMTTHSPYLVNQLKPEELIVVEKRDGKTECRRIKDVDRLKKSLEQSGFLLGDLWYEGEFGEVR